MSEVLFPVGRMIGGNLYKMFQRKNDDGTPKFQQDGVTPVMQASFGVAFAKDPAFPHWSQTSWGQKVMSVGAAGYPDHYQHPDFAWKVTDGDAKNGKKPGSKAPCTLAGYPGHWVIWFSQSWQPKLCNADGTQVLTQEDAIVPGYFVQVLADVIDNKPSKSAGVYMNPKAVALSGYGEKIVGAGEVDTTKAGFGGALPAGASAVPVGAMTAAAPAPLTLAAAPAPASAAPILPAIPVVVQPNTAYMAPPPVAAPAPPPVAVPRIVKNATTGESADYAQMCSIGWTDALLAQHGWA